MRKKLINLGNVNLGKEEKGIVRYLGTDYDESASLHDITKYLRDVGYEHVTRKDVLEKIEHLIDVGYVRSRTKCSKTENFKSRKRSFSIGK